MGHFVLGILVGWLAEWFFYTFWVKGNEGSDCTALRNELAEKKRQISTLEDKLNNAGVNSVKSRSGANKKAEANTSTAATSTAKKPASKSKAPVKATAGIKAAPAKTKTRDKKSTTSKTATKTKTTAKAKSASKTKTSGKAKAGGDDFTKISGIGPSMAANLKDLGIDSFSKLAATDDDILRDMLEASGARMNNNKEVMDSWNEQATIAAKGDFSALKKMQEEMKK